MSLLDMYHNVRTETPSSDLKFFVIVDELQRRTYGVYRLRFGEGVYVKITVVVVMGKLGCR